MHPVTSILLKLSTRKKIRSDYDSLLPDIPFHAGIQHNLFQTNKTKHNLNKDIENNIRKLQDMNPQWTYRIFDDNDIEEYIRQYYGDVILSFYNRIDSHYGAAKADFFRYLVIYREGGVYLDLKSTVNLPLDQVIHNDDSYILSYWNNLPGQGHEGFGHYPGLPDYIERGEIIQWYLAAAAGHPLLRKIIIKMLENIDRYNPYINGVGWTGTVTTTGPVMYTREIYDLLRDDPESFPVRWTDIIESCGFQYSIFMAAQGDSPSAPLHTRILSSDYRKATTPVIKHPNPVINYINRIYLSLLNRLH